MSSLPRCLKCGQVLPHYQCTPVDKPSFDLSHEQLVRIDEAAGQLLKEILRHKSVEAIKVSTFGPEFFNLLDLRRRL